MIEILYPKKSKSLALIEEQLIDANIGYKLTEDQELGDLKIIEGGKTYLGIAEANKFISTFLVEVEGWGRCACEDKDY